ncbi:DUF4439 domain-containing protein [Acaricomes phytoseiuli]|uniref:DUF4439 domain-containing protein n=1 Tax=Acaricomes phytoseiuli TaxID=291968 RepID=UPI0003700230|nr:DUF4439 domain-containing protein [Acaricomes phytoseiuli]
MNKLTGDARPDDPSPSGESDDAPRPSAPDTPAAEQGATTSQQAAQQVSVTRKKRGKSRRASAPAGAPGKPVAPEKPKQAAQPDAVLMIPSAPASAPDPAPPADAVPAAETAESETTDSEVEAETAESSTAAPPTAQAWAEPALDELGDASEDNEDNSDHSTRSAATVSETESVTETSTAEAPETAEEPAEAPLPAEDSERSAPDADDESEEEQEEQEEARSEESTAAEAVAEVLEAQQPEAEQLEEVEAPEPDPQEPETQEAEAAPLETDELPASEQAAEGSEAEDSGAEESEEDSQTAVLGAAETAQPGTERTEQVIGSASAAQISSPEVEAEPATEQEAEPALERSESEPLSPAAQEDSLPFAAEDTEDSAGKADTSAEPDAPQVTESTTVNDINAPLETVPGDDEPGPDDETSVGDTPSPGHETSATAESAKAEKTEDEAVNPEEDQGTEIAIAGAGTSAAAGATALAGAQTLRPRGRERRDALAAHQANPASDSLDQPQDLEQPKQRSTTGSAAPSTNRSIARWVRRVLLLILVLALVLVTGSVITERNQLGETPNPAETAREEALSSAQRLLTAATSLQQAAPGATVPGLDYSVKTLTAAAEALRPSGTAAALAEDPASVSVPSAADKEAPRASSVPELIDGLRASAQRTIDSAADPAVDSGMARLLAAAGSGQAGAAQYLGQLAQQQREPLALSQPAPMPTPQATSCTGQGNTGQQEGPGLQAALSAVSLAEQRAVYSYQVALPRLASGPLVASAQQSLGTHQNALTSAERLIREACGQVPPREPGFALDTDFLNQPGPGLGRLEDQISLVYGDLIGLSEGEARSWALGRLLSTVQSQLLWGTPDRALPGLAETARQNQQNQ